MGISVNTNQSALIALQALNRSGQELSASQNRVSTGLKIGAARDNPAVYAIAEAQRADVGALGAVNISLDRASSIADVALAGAESISDLLGELKTQALAAKDTSLDTFARTSINTNFQAVLRQIAEVVDTTEFDGSNLLNGTIATSLRFLTEGDATGTITLGAHDMRLSGSILTMSAGSEVTTPAMADRVLAQISESLENVNTTLAGLGAQARQVEAHKGFVSKLADVLTAGVGQLVDADLAKEGARLEALQVRQQLGAQSLSIANQAPQIVLQLFRS